MEDFDVLIEYLRKHFAFDAEDEKLAKLFFEPIEVKKNEIILEAGKTCNYLYFIDKGLLRTFHTNSNGTEFTRLIASENDFCTILISFQGGTSSPAAIQALENGKILRISYENFRKFITASENANKIYIKILEDFQNFQIQRIEFLTSYNPQEKVVYFLKENAAIEPRLADKIIASYLQITPETYSRCKKKLSS